MSVHTRVKAHGCYLCDKAFSENNNLKKHMNMYDNIQSEEKYQRSGFD